MGWIKCSVFWLRRHIKIRLSSAECWIKCCTDWVLPTPPISFSLSRIGFYCFLLCPHGNITASRAWLAQRYWALRKSTDVTVIITSRIQLMNIVKNCLCQDNVHARQAMSFSFSLSSLPLYLNGSCVAESMKHICAEHFQVVLRSIDHAFLFCSAFFIRFCVILLFVEKLWG